MPSLKESYLKKIQERQDALAIFNEEKTKSKKVQTKSYDDSVLLSKGLKVTHKKSQFLYTVDSVESNGVVLRTPEQNRIFIPTEELESQYEIG